MSNTTLRQFFKFLNRFMIGMWRLGMGPLINVWPQFIGRIMVITHTGRKSGALRRTPVNYAMLDGDLYCLSGYGAGSDWYKNILASPSVEVWLPQGWWSAQAYPADDLDNRLEILRSVLINSGFAAPLFAGVHPRKMSDLELDLLSRDYRLVRIHRTQACTGSGSPSDLAWVWPAAAHILVFGWLIKRIVEKCTKKRSI